jgi:dTDP-glucose 4,6-dehydratase
MQVRDWLYVEDNCEAIDLVLRKGRVGEIYNIGADNEHTNMEITNIILEELNKPSSLIEHVTDRLGHDRRYSIDSTRIKKLGWKPKKSQNFKQSMKHTIRWYVKNEWWWKKLVK